MSEEKLPQRQAVVVLVAQLLLPNVPASAIGEAAASGVTAGQPLSSARGTDRAAAAPAAYAGLATSSAVQPAHAAASASAGKAQGPLAAAAAAPAQTMESATGHAAASAAAAPATGQTDEGGDPGVTDDESDSCSSDSQTSEQAVATAQQKPAAKAR